MKKNQAAIFLLVLMLVSLACGTSGGETARESTVEALSAEVYATGTASAAQGPQVTQVTDLGNDSLTATAAAFAPILADLPKYEVDPSEGKIGWVHPPVSLDASGYHHFEYVNYFIGTLAQDFVISADITWNTVGSTSGCGFVLRSDGNENALDQYVAIITRVASGHFLFSTMSDGEVVTGRDIYARYSDKSFRWENDTTNRLTIVGRGNHFWVYTNDILIGEVDPSAPPAKPNLPPEPEKPANQSDPQAMALYKQQKAEHEEIIAQIMADYAARQRAYSSADTVFDRGFMAMVALSESGRSTTCKFDNAWLFLIDSPPP
jgi:outer membrane lipoprotein-sorting protein